jgi:hypothetical protein
VTRIEARAFGGLLIAAALGCSGGGAGAGAPDAGDPDTFAVLPDAGDPATFAVPPASCSMKCPYDECAEKDHAYECPSTKAWDAIPHAALCPAWDGTYPAAVPGKCTASTPSGDAAKYAGADPDDPSTLILPDGRRVHPAGVEWIWDEPDAPAHVTTAIVAVPGTSTVLTLDDGVQPAPVRAIDTSKMLPGGPSPVTGRSTAVDLDKGLVYVSTGHVYAGSANGWVLGFTFDATTGSLSADDERLELPPSTGVDVNGTNHPFYVAGVGASRSGIVAVAGTVDPKLVTFDLNALPYPSHRSPAGEVDLPEAGAFLVSFDPNDPTGHFAYVSMWLGKSVVEVDVSAPAAPNVTRTFATGTSPEGLAFLDARWMVVADAIGDSLSVVDRMSGVVTKLAINADDAHGYMPSSIAYDPTSKRLYAALAGVDAIGAWDVDASTTPPTIAPAGRLPTAWWPSGIAILGDGSLAVSSLRGHGMGPHLEPFAVGSGDIIDALHGGVQHIPAPSATDLAQGEAAVDKATNVGALAGRPTITCPPGADDFPVGETNQRASTHIQHVFFIVRENKTFDGLFGDLANVAGDPSYTFKQTSAEMERVWPNLRKLARQFAITDNYYTSAEASGQGHEWTAFGRSSDYLERMWFDSFLLTGYPARDEGSIFDWLCQGGVTCDDLGEFQGTHAQPDGTFSPMDPNYSLSDPDNQNGCYLAGRIRVRCDTGSFVYIALPDDHTFGVAPGTPSPETCVAVNDEGTGIVVDAVSHSPLWASSLVLITEDDPASGGDHVDAHRTLLAAASPWVKRGYVSKTHVDVASIHKLIANIFGAPYPNLQVAEAALPLDLFTSTPDYAPFEYTPRVEPLTCGVAATRAERRLTASFDFDDVDLNPDLDAQVARWMRGRQLEELTPELEARIAAREAARAREYERDDERERFGRTRPDSDSAPERQGARAARAQD